MIRFALVLSAGMMTGCTIAQDSCDYTAPRELDLDAAGVDRLDVVARAGSLDIQGEAGLERVIVRGRVCASSAELLDPFAGDGLRLVTCYPFDGVAPGTPWRFVITARPV